MDEVIVQFGSPSPAYGRPSPREGDLLGKTLANKLDDLQGQWSQPLANCGTSFQPQTPVASWFDLDRARRRLRSQWNESPTMRVES